MFAHLRPAAESMIPTTNRRNATRVAQDGIESES
ncbi:3-phosphoglycerate dehydrogenase [Burkholderia thailandensis]|nr:3-phosphoglycerate dehydrogenase [Burkholderia thailandensis]AOI52373.1 3-phosphoglycerate dehydrogenase [Burkholderia thailandensis]AOJ44781.1 3-phosphoglycerate dehydrogenase [Burkholderia thailandensis]AOJ51353.1 3-phosphoglycerate dehydrogenase [Burkholderia thailandensis]AOJ56355.1 3-phosphoglycerate dehydrogenase [Burkholderia thailandensis]